MRDPVRLPVEQVAFESYVRIVQNYFKTNHICITRTVTGRRTVVGSVLILVSVY
jgi:hypothetical protein